MSYLNSPVLVTGGAGYIGGQTVLCLLDLGADVIVIDDLSTGSVRPFHEKVKFYEGNIQNQTLVEDIIRTNKVQSILHFAGSIKVDESVSNPLKYYDNNTEASRKLIAAAVACDVPQFVFSSTAAVYGTVEGQMTVPETAATMPLNAYGWSKLFTERMLRDAERAYGLQFAALRYFNVAGADPKLRHGQFLKNPVHLIGRTIDAAIGDAGPLDIFGANLPTPDGTGVRDYIHVYDLAMAHLAMLEYLGTDPASITMNLGYGRGASVLEVIECIENALNCIVPHRFVEPRDGEAPSVVANIDALLSALDWTPQFNDVREIVKSAVAWKLQLDGNEGR